MKDRKQHVIEKAHQLFIEKGFQATSIQDILDFSGISKGTFYNYFSSKNELLIAIFKSIFKNMDRERNELLIGQDPSDIEIFIKQMEIQMRSNKKNRLFTLFEEVMFSNDAEMKEFLKRGQFFMLRWLYNRFIDLFGEDKKAYLMDCAIMFMGILQQNIHFDHLANGTITNISKVVRYSVERMVGIVGEVFESGNYLIGPELLANWIPECKENGRELKDQLIQIRSDLKKMITKNSPNEEDQEKYLELLNFIQEELMHIRSPRKYLIESALATLKSEISYYAEKELNQLEKLISDYR
ncbi:TetR/AcrR family transcriptional regulator [Neobacillus niacini]|uniref:TetR/AcrR family transcriptional regulator n=1 Tax=Neobacillus niacini TaxID=86668 RepID=UPI002862B526|nr:TetR/AcrR family transcriptional regulator [Neobacillus niacini]MDR7001058.1 AcrR family transcriptional regulator [Neobacillus niacini]